MIFLNNSVMKTTFKVQFEKVYNNCNLNDFKGVYLKSSFI